MGYSLKDIIALLQMPAGRLLLSPIFLRRAWPVLLRLAILYRRTLIRKTRIVTVVGSFGKSTTTLAVLTALGMDLNPIVNLNARTAVARAVLRIWPWSRHAVIEVGIAAPGQMATYARITRPDVTVVTSIGSEHNRSLPTLEVTREEKCEMVRILPASGIAILNGDDPNVLWMKDQTHARVLTFGINKTNDIRASDITLDWPNGTSFKLQAGGETRDLHIRLIGKQMVYPILAAIAVALAGGLSLDQVVPALEALPPTPGRLEPIQLQNGAFILRDDFKAQLETIDVALDVLSEIPAQRRIVVLGDIEEPPGGKSPIYRQIGERIGKIASVAIFVGGHSCRKYASGAKRSGLSGEKIMHVGEDVLKAAELLHENVGPGDVVLIKGRGNQRLGRVALSLMGRKVRCDIRHCNLRVYCENCSMLERGWRRS